MRKRFKNIIYYILYFFQTSKYDRFLLDLTNSK